MEQEVTPATSPAIQPQENNIYNSFGSGLKHSGLSTVHDPFHQLEGFQLFAYFTANIIQEDVPFTR